jgi:hypothetical protein
MLGMPLLAYPERVFEKAFFNLKAENNNNNEASLAALQQAVRESAGLPRLLEFILEDLVFFFLRSPRFFALPVSINVLLSCLAKPQPTLHYEVNCTTLRSSKKKQVLGF